jgi:diguanylate cyclase (GGDEF)-like protein
MPQIDGVELARMIRQCRRHLSLPIAFLSAEDDLEAQLRARRFGGDDFISKRTDPSLLVRQVEMRLDRARVLRKMIERDGLTGLVNHTRFCERIAHELERCRRTGAECALVMIDLDHFKVVNDSWGHQAGDLVLRRLASELTSWLRRIDVVGRYGGEEFAALMLDTTPAQAMPVIDAFRRHFAGLDMATREGTFRVTFSAGIAGSAGAAGVPGFIAAADAALYLAKKTGRDRVATASSVAPARPTKAGTPERRHPGLRRRSGAALASH